MQAVALEERNESAQEGLKQRLDVGVLGRRQRVEGAVIGKDALRDEHVEVDVDVELKGRAEPLDEADCAALAGGEHMTPRPGTTRVEEGTDKQGLTDPRYGRRPRMMTTSGVVLRLRLPNAVKFCPSTKNPAAAPPPSRMVMR